MDDFEYNICPRKEGWTYRKLGEICYPKAQIIRATKVFAPHDEIKYIDISSIDNSIWRMTGYTKYVMSDAPSRAQQCVQNGDIIVSTVRPNLKNIAIVEMNDDNLVASSGFCVLRPSNVERNYLFHYITSDIFTSHLISLTTGANYPAVRDSDIFDSVIPLPPKPLQHAIVAELDLLTGIIDKQKAQLGELNALAQSIFYDMFGDPIENEKGWEIKRLRQIAQVKTGPFGSMLHKDDYVTGGIPLVNPIHMKGYTISPDWNFSVTAEKANELSDYLLRKGDIVFARRGDIGRCAVVDMEDGFLCGTGSVFVRFTIPISSIYLMYVIRHESFKNELISKAKGATMLNLNSDTISELIIPLPPDALQESFAQKIQSIESQKESINRSIAETQKLFDYTMDKYFG